MTRKPGILILVAMMSITAAAQGIRPQDVEFQRAKRTETVDDDARGAIRQYTALVNKYAKSDPAIVAQALVRMGRLYERVGDTQAANATFERVVRDYPGQKQPLAEAQQALGRATRRMTQERVSAGVGDKGAAAVSPDGRWIQFESRSGMIIRRNGAARDHVSLPEAEAAVFSPDSKRVVFNHWGKRQLQVASLEGQWSPRVVKANPADVRYYNPGGWSADGRSVLLEIVHQDSTKEIAWLTLATGETRVLLNIGRRRPQDPGEKLRLSPDGRLIVYSAFPADPDENDQRPTENRERHLYLLPAQGGTPTELVGGSVNVRPLWTPNSRHVVFVSNRSGSFGLWSINAAEKGVGPVVEMAASGRITPVGITTGGDLYFARNETGNDIFVSELRSDGRVGTPVLLPTRASGSNILPAWSPDRRFVAYLRARKEKRAETYALIVHSMSDHTERVFDARELGYHRPEWFADGKRLIVVESEGMRGLVVDLESSTFTLARDVFGFAVGALRQPSLSPDGKTIYVTAPVKEGVENARGEVVVDTNAVPFTVTAVDLMSGTRRVVLPADLGLRRFNLLPSPDGRSLAFVSAKAGEPAPALWSVGVDGQGLRQLATSPDARMFVWASDSQSIYFLQQRGDVSRLMRVPVNGGPAQDAGLAMPYDKQRGATLAGNQLVFAQESIVRDLWVVKDFASR